MTPTHVEVPCMAHMRYRVILEPDSGQVAVTVPAFPEIHTCGDDRADALAMARDAIALAIAHYGDVGREIPPSDSENADVAMIDITTAA